MTKSRRPKEDRFPLGRGNAAETLVGASLEDALLSARHRLEADAIAWINDVAAANAALGRELGARKDARVSDVRARLGRLEQALRQAPAQWVEHLRQSTTEIASTDTELLRRIGEYEVAERYLSATNEQLTRDISRRVRLEGEARVVERSLREGQERFESAFNHAPIGMALIAMDGRWLQVNDALCRISGHSADELRATTLRAMTHPEDVDIDGQDLEQLVAGEVSSYQVEKRLLHNWGHFFWVLVTISLVRDEDRKPVYLVTQVQDISERKEMAQRLEYVVHHDFLTGLLNRRHFEQELARETDRAARYGSPGAVLLIDLDNFKDVNDSFGHRAGDDVLKGVAGLLRQRLRQTDIIARVGGDEFAVILPQTEMEQVQVVADEVVKTLSRQTAVLADQSIRITASLGVAMFDGLTAGEVLAHADLAIYEAKETGRNRFEMYRPRKGGPAHVSARLAEAERIRLALEEDRLVLYCQPILDLGAHEFSQYELLLRLPGEELGEMVLPYAFLYHAERSGLIQAIDCWVVLKAITMIAEHNLAGNRLVLNVNLSGKSIGDRRLTALVETALNDSGIDPAQLVFELTETAAISNIEDAKAFAVRLHDKGCRFALDDFGAGFGSFYYLKSFPFDYLKIDGDFIRDLAGSHMNQLVVSAIVNIARGMGKKTVAEFVEDEDTVRLLRTIGVDYAQGYHIGRPRPVLDCLQVPARGAA